MIPIASSQERLRKKREEAAEETGLLMPETLWVVPTGPPPPLLFPLAAQYSQPMSKKVGSRLGEGKGQVVFGVLTSPGAELQSQV